MTDGMVLAVCSSYSGGVTVGICFRSVYLVHVIKYV